MGDKLPYTKIIAEAGVNHNGSIDIAKKLIDAASEAGADFIKFQTFKTESLVSSSASLADYQKNNLGSKAGTTQFEMLKKLELNEEAHKILIDYCNKKNIDFLSAPFDLESINLLNNLGLKTFKIPSGEITNYSYLKKIGSLDVEIIMSTGMATLTEIEEALNLLISSGATKENISILHCNTEYPTPFEDVNLLAMLTIKEKLGVNIGYSDHTKGIEVAVAATALGATIIEKHITLDKNMEGPDHKASLNPEEFKLMVDSIRNINVALGSPEKKTTPSELKNISLVRKSIHFSRDFKTGHILTEADLTVKRPGNGISPMKTGEVIGKKLIVDVKSDTMLKWDQIL